MTGFDASTTTGWNWRGLGRLYSERSTVNAAETATAGTFSPPSETAGVVPDPAAVGGAVGTAGPGAGTATTTTTEEATTLAEEKAAEPTEELVDEIDEEEIVSSAFDFIVGAGASGGIVGFKTLATGTVGTFSSPTGANFLGDIPAELVYVAAGSRLRLRLVRSASTPQYQDYFQSVEIPYGTGGGAPVSPLLSTLANFSSIGGFVQWEWDEPAIAFPWINNAILNGSVVRGEPSNTLSFPSLDLADPSSGLPGDSVILFGGLFDPEISSNIVIFTGPSSGGGTGTFLANIQAPLDPSLTTLTVTVPTGLASGSSTIRVKAGVGSYSPAIPFDITIAGTVDPTYGGSPPQYAGDFYLGFTGTNPPFTTSVAMAAVILPDDSIITVGYTIGQFPDPVLLSKYDTNGDLDPTFGGPPPVQRRAAAAADICNSWTGSSLRNYECIDGVQGY